MKRIALPILLAISGLLVSVQADARSYHYHHAHSYYGPRSGNHYTNVDGHSVHSPMVSDQRPYGATAHCLDGTWSFSQHHQGTCSHHGGVQSW